MAKKGDEPGVITLTDPDGQPMYIFPAEVDKVATTKPEGVKVTLTVPTVSVPAIAGLMINFQKKVVECTLIEVPPPPETEDLDFEGEGEEGEKTEGK